MLTLVADPSHCLINIYLHNVSLRFEVSVCQIGARNRTEIMSGDCLVDFLSIENWVTSRGLIIDACLVS